MIDGLIMIDDWLWLIMIDDDWWLLIDDHDGLIIIVSFLFRAKQDEAHEPECSHVC